MKVLRILLAVIAAPIYVPFALLVSLIISIFEWFELCDDIVEGIIYGRK